MFQGRGESHVAAGSLGGAGLDCDVVRWLGDGIQAINRRRCGALNSIGYGDAAGADSAVTASKTLVWAAVHRRIPRLGGMFGRVALCDSAS